MRPWRRLASLFATRGINYKPVIKPDQEALLRKRVQKLAQETEVKASSAKISNSNADDHDHEPKKEDNSKSLLSTYIPWSIGNSNTNKATVEEKTKKSQTPSSGFLNIPSYLTSFASTSRGSSKASQTQNVITEIVLSREEVDAKTKKLVQALFLTATTDRSHVKRLEEFSLHMLKYPEAKGVAIRNNAIGRILDILEQSDGNQATKLQAREALAYLGYHEPLKSGGGIRILAIDGGGMRGVIALEMLQAIERETGKRIHDLFDFICGVSTGAIIASFLGFHKISIPEIINTYNTIGKKVFKQSVLEGATGWVLSHSYYNTKLYEEILKQFVGDFPMHGIARSLQQTPKVAIVSTLVSDERITPFVFRSYDLPYRVYSSYKGSSRYPVWAATRASSAAPGYFDEFLLDKTIHHDGGLIANNATHIAIHEAQKLWPNRHLQCVISMGLGRNELPLAGFQKSGSSFSDAKSDKTEEEKIPKALSLAQKFSRIVDSATDTELVHETLNDNLPRRVYYRFNPYLPEYLPLDETRPEKMSLMVESANMYLRRNRNKLVEACDQLTLSKLPWTRAQEYIKLKTNVIQSRLSKGEDHDMN